MKHKLLIVLATLLAVLFGCSSDLQSGADGISGEESETYISLQAEALVTVAKAYYDREIWYQYDNNYKEGGTQLYRIQYR